MDVFRFPHISIEKSPIPHNTLRGLGDFNSFILLLRTPSIQLTVDGWLR